MSLLGVITRPVELAAWLGREAIGIAGAVVGEVRSAVGGAQPAPERSDPTPPAPPAVPFTARTLDDAPVLAGEFGDDGFGEEAGPQVDIAEPWEGYEAMSVDELRERIERASQEVLATVVLYEGANRGRRGVIRVAERRLAELAATN